MASGTNTAKLMKSKKKPNGGSLERRVRARLEAAKARLKERWLKKCEEMLTAAGVPQWVCINGETVPSNTVPSRLGWYLLRRKDVQPWECDGIDKEMELAMDHARKWIPYGERPNDEMSGGEKRDA